MFGKIAWFSVKFRWLIIVAWIVAVPVIVHSFPKIADVQKNNVSDFLPKNSPTSQGAQLEQAFQLKSTASNTFLVISRDNGQLTAADNAAVSAMAQKVKAVKDVSEVKDLGVSSDGQAHELFVGVTGAAFGQGAVTLVQNIRDAAHSVTLPSGAQAHLTGELVAAVDQENSNSSGRNKTEGYTVLLILVLLFLVFRSALAPIVTLVPAGIALTVAQPVIAESTKIGVQVGFITQILLIVLILGAGTDYGLFLVFRVREELRNGLEPKEAVVKALSRVGESITYSAATVVAALLALLLASFGMYKGLGPALAIGLGVMLLISLTFLPAVLAVLGRAVFWPSKTTKREQKIGMWGRLADYAITKPKAVLIIGAIIFGGLAAGLSGYRSAGFGNQNPPVGTDSAAGQAVVAKHFPAANDNPDLLILHFPTSVWDNLSAVQSAQAKLSASKTYTAISGPFNANGFSFTQDQLKALHDSGQGAVLQAVSQFIGKDGKTVQFYGNLRAGPSGSVEAMRAIPAARVELASIAGKVGADQNTIYGSDSVAYDINKTTGNDLRKIIPIVLLLIAALLALMLRSLVAPWYLIITVALSYLASLGFAMLVFVHLFHQGGLNFVLPFLMFVFGMALGEDYNILVMSRIREEAHKEPSLAKAVTKAVGITGTTVTSAGLILAGTFTVLGIVGGNSQVEQIGFGVAFGILLDTFFVRTLLVPAIVAMLGRYNWWPSKLSRSKSQN